MKNTNGKITNASPSVAAFKRLEVGTTFADKRGGNRFRKVTSTEAVALLPNGRGKVDTKIPFSRSANVVVLAK
jgi:hypothetical protein